MEERSFIIHCLSFYLSYLSCYRPTVDSCLVLLYQNNTSAVQPVGSCQNVDGPQRLTYTSQIVSTLSRFSNTQLGQIHSNVLTRFIQYSFAVFPQYLPTTNAHTTTEAMAPASILEVSTPLDSTLIVPHNARPSISYLEP